MAAAEETPPLSSLRGYPTEEALMACKAHVHDLFNQVPAVAIQGYAADGTTLFWNAASEQLYGYTAEEAIGRNRLDLLVEPEHQGKLADGLKRMAATGIAGPPGELTLRHKNGSQVAVFSSHAVTRIPGKAPEIFSFDIDRTANKLAEKALHASEERHRSILNASPDAIAITALDGRILMVSPAGLAMFRHVGSDQMLGHLITEFIVPEDRERALSNIGLMFQGIMTGPAEYKASHPDGGTFDIEANAEFIRGADGKPGSMVFVVRDITARKQSEAVMRLGAAALEATANAILITDRNGVIEWVNPAFTSFTGYSAEESIGREPGELLKSGKHPPPVYRELWETILAGQVWRGEMINRRKNGSLFTEEMTVTPVRDEHGEISHFIAVKQDITRRKLLEEQFLQSQKMDAFGQLAGGVAHDFNNILAAMMMQAEMLSTADGLTAELSDGIRQIRSDAARAANLTRQLLLFSRRQIFQAREVDLNEIVRNLARMLHRIIGEEISLELEPSPEPLVTHADAGMLDQLLMNLVLNARDAMPGGGRIRIVTDRMEITAAEALTIPEARPGRYVRLIVKDDGCGIPNEHLDRIFEPFFTTKEPGRGTGLGLPTVFGIVKQHDGWMKVDSREGAGTTFHVHLPESHIGTDAPSPGIESNRVKGGSETILLVEDESGLRRVTSLVLRKNGYRVFEASHGLEALEVWNTRSADIDLLLTDMVMPEGFTGTSLAAELLKSKPTLRVVFTSGYSSHLPGMENTLTSGLNFIQKPASPQILLQTVRNCLDS